MSRRGRESPGFLSRHRKRRALPPAEPHQYLAQFEDSSVHYWASPIEARLCEGQEVALVGAGNSAGQAAVYLASQVGKVSLIVRGREPRGLGCRAIRSSASRRQPNIEIVLRTRSDEAQRAMKL